MTDKTSPCFQMAADGIADIAANGTAKDVFFLNTILDLITVNEDLYKRVQALESGVTSTETFRTPIREGYQSPSAADLSIAF